MILVASHMAILPRSQGSGARRSRAEVHGGRMSSGASKLWKDSQPCWEGRGSVVGKGMCWEGTCTRLLALRGMQRVGATVTLTCHTCLALCVRENTAIHGMFPPPSIPFSLSFFFCTLRDKRLPWIDACFCLRANRKLASGRPTDAFVNMCLHILLLFFACTSI